MVIDTSKLQRQEQIAQNWRNNRGIGGAQVATGFGKTFTTLYCICKRMFEKDPNHRIIVVVPRTNLREQWRKEIEKLLPDFKDRFFVETVQWFQDKNLKFDCSLLVLDEADEYYATDRKKIWDGTWINFRYFLWLSADATDVNSRHKEFIARFPIIDSITMDEAVENGWVSPYIVYNIGVDLTEEERSAYDFAEEALQSNLSKFDGDFKRAAKCLGGHKDGDKTYTGYECCLGWAHRRGWSPQLAGMIEDPSITKDVKEIAKNTISLWNPNVIMGYAKEVMKWQKAKSDIIFKAEKKKEMVLAIIEKFPSNKIITFGQSTQFADSLYEAVTEMGKKAVIYHTNLPSQPLKKGEDGKPSLTGEGDWIRITTKNSPSYGQVKLFGQKTLKELALSTIRSGQADIAITASALDKGTDIPILDMGIFTSSTSNPNQFLQRKGRTTRLIDGKKAIIVCVYVKHSREYYTLVKAQNDSSNIYFINSINEIGREHNSPINFTDFSI